MVKWELIKGEKQGDFNNTHRHSWICTSMIAKCTHPFFRCHQSRSRDAQVWNFDGNGMRFIVHIYLPAMTIVLAKMVCIESFYSHYDPHSTVTINVKHGNPPEGHHTTNNHHMPSYPDPLSLHKSNCQHKGDLKQNYNVEDTPIFWKWPKSHGAQAWVSTSAQFLFRGIL